MAFKIMKLAVNKRKPPKKRYTKGSSVSNIDMVVTPIIGLFSYVRYIEKCNTTGGYLRDVTDKEFNKLKKAKQKRSNNILKTHGCVCFCPGCDDPLNDQAQCDDNEFVHYVCSVCNTISRWTFDAAPTPLLLNSYLWIKYNDKQPVHGQSVIYFYKYIGVHRGTFDRSNNEDPSFVGENGGISALGGTYWMANDNDLILEALISPEDIEYLPR